MEEIQIIGNLNTFKLSEVNNKFVLNFTLAVNKRINGEKTTVWYNCVKWYNEKPKMYQYLEKGKKIFIKGYPKASYYQKKNDNKIYPIIEITANSNIIIL